MLLFMLASGLTLILSMMGVLNFAHASVYMLGAYFAYQISRWVGFWPALIVAPVLCGRSVPRSRCGACGASITTATSPNCCSPSASCSSSAARVQMTWGMLPMPYRVPACSISRCSRCTASNFPAYRGFMLLVSARMLVAIWLLLKKTRIGLIIQASLTHPDMVSALGHDVPRVFTTVFAGGSAAGGPRRRDRRQLPHHRVRAWPTRWDRSCSSW